MKTIFGLASAPGRSGVAVIRISGDTALAALMALGIKPPKPRLATLRQIVYESEIIDEAIIIYYPAPHSFTGEDIVELQVHGSRAVISRLMEILAKLPDLRLAEPGEFSRRAFTNGRMDLTEAEGLADLIEAETLSQHRQAMRQMQGALGRIYDGWRARIIENLAFLEAYIDFPDEDLPAELSARIENNIKLFQDEIARHLNDNRRGEKIREGLRIVILGAPNVGKSSLLNYLAGREAAIVSAIAGTTRDVIEVHLEIGGYPVIISDTAGLRDTNDEIENEGIRRARERAQDADLKILMFEAGSEPGEQSLAELDAEAFIVINKIDITRDDRFADAHHISLRSGKGVDQLLAALGKKISDKYGISDSPLITRVRHREALEKALVALHNFSLEKPVELAGEDLRLAAYEIGRITGKIDVDDILDVIFSSFCIGK